MRYIIYTDDAICMISDNTKLAVQNESCILKIHYDINEWWTISMIRYESTYIYKLVISCGNGMLMLMEQDRNDQ